MMSDRILGYAPIDGLDTLLAVLNSIPGPAVEAWHGSRLAALLQSEPEDALFCSQRISHATGLLSVQRRLEAACHAGPFLPQDPAAATVPSDTVPSLLASAWSALEGALFSHGNHHQWDILLRWSPGAVIAQLPFAPAADKASRLAAIRTALQAERTRQEARLLNTLSRAVLAFAADGSSRSDSGITITALTEAGCERRMEQALEDLEEPDLSIEMRGPLPPLTFAPVRVATTETFEITAAWRTLELEDLTDRTSAQRQWRSLAASLRPDRQAHLLSGAAPGIAGLTDAYRLLRSLLPSDGASATLAGTLARAGRRLVVPDTPVVVDPPLNRPAMELAL